MAQHNRYISPFSTRYASDEMQYIFSDDNKFKHMAAGCGSHWLRRKKRRALPSPMSRSPSWRPTRTISTMRMPSPAKSSSAMML